MKPRHFLLCVTSLLITVTLHAEPIALFNTGVDSSGLTLPGGEPDVHWSVVAGPGITTAISAVTLNNQFPETYAQSTLSKWVWIDAGGLAAIDSPYTLQLTFDLSEFDHESATISGQWAADNEGFILLNGSSNNIGSGTLALSGTVPSHFTTFHSFSLTNGFLRHSGLTTGFSRAPTIYASRLGVFGGLRIDFGGLKRTLSMVVWDPGRIGGGFSLMWLVLTTVYADTPGFVVDDGLIGIECGVLRNLAGVVGDSW